MHKKPPYTNNPYEKPSHTNDRTLTIRMKNHYTIIMRINIFVVINQPISTKQKYITNAQKYISNYYKKMLLFFFTEYKNEWEQNKFRRQKSQKSDFYNNKDKKIFNIDDIDVNKILVSKKEKYGQ